MNDFAEQDNHRKIFALIICLFLGFMYLETIWKPYFQPDTTVPSSPETLAQAGTKSDPGKKAPLATDHPGTSDAPALSEASSEQSTLQTAPENREYPSDKQLQEAGNILVQTTTITARVSLLGGRINELLLNEYRADLEGVEDKLNLIQHTDYAPLPLGVYSGQVNDAWVRYQLASPGGMNPTEGATSFRLDVQNTNSEMVLQGVLSDGRQITKKFTFHPQGYFIDLQVSLSASAPDGSRTALELTKFLSEEESSVFDYYGATSIVWFDGERAFREKVSDLSTEQLKLTDLTWVSIADKYFMASLLSRSGGAQGTAFSTDEVYRIRMYGDESAGSFSLFLGPMSYRMLENIGFGLERNIDFGMTGFIAAPLLLLLHWFYDLFGNYGLAIVTLTILVRLALYPLNATSFRQMKAMQDLKPEIDRVREQVKDKQQQQMELMGLYKKRGVNPLGGCLPVLIQMPVFIGLYSALMLAVELRHAEFALWIADLSAPEKCMIGGVAIPVMVILFVISMMVQQWTTPSSMDPTQKKVMMVMPLVFGFMFMNFPAGLTLYWLTNNLISIGQQKAMHRVGGNGKSALLITLGCSAVVFTLAFIVTLF